ncbi:hypothetical protein JYT79_00055 [Cardiobacterium sp. AH-315-I02]|nr:hypothetical protein [Cardiobacterium sp. AH-315-I02]
MKKQRKIWIDDILLIAYFEAKKRVKKLTICQISKDSSTKEKRLKQEVIKQMRLEVKNMNQVLNQRWKRK